MSVLPDLENELLRAAARPRHRWWWPTSRALVLVTGLALVGGAAGAAGLGLVAAEPDAPEHIDQEIPIAITGQPVRNGALTPVRTPDPDGGPPWGIRITSTSRGAACIQVGRVVDDQLVVLGRDGAFDDDGRAHVIPVGRDICVPTTTDGTPLLRSRGTTTTSSGLELCRDRLSRPVYEREQRAAIARRDKTMANARPRALAGKRLPPYRSVTDAEWRSIEAAMCPKGAYRALRWGFLGPQATAASYRTADGRTTDQPIAPNGLGAYLFVQRLPDDRADRFAAIQRPGTVRATFEGTGTKTITGPGRIRAIPGVELPTSHRDRGPVDASFSLPRTRSGSASVRFRAPVDALRYPTAFKAYVEPVRTPGRPVSRCQGSGTLNPDEDSMPVTPPIRKGQTATLVVHPPRRREGRKPTWCPGTHRIRLIQIGGSARGSVTLATRTFVVP
jgi:hypothetical protein